MLISRERSSFYRTAGNLLRQLSRRPLLNRPQVTAKTIKFQITRRSLRRRRIVLGEANTSNECFDRPGKITHIIYIDLHDSRNRRKTLKLPQVVIFALSFRQRFRVCYTGRSAVTGSRVIKGGVFFLFSNNTVAYTTC